MAQQYAILPPTELARQVYRLNAEEKGIFYRRTAELCVHGEADPHPAHRAAASAVPAADTAEETTAAE